MQFAFKFCWLLRAILLKPFFGKLSFPSYIGAPIFLLGTGRVFIGRKVGIFPGIRIECHGRGKLVIEDNVAIAQGVHVTCMGEVRIGQRTRITGFVSITDIEHDYKRDRGGSGDETKCVRTEIGSDCFIGMGARIQAGTILGNGCVVGANSVVRGIFPDNSMIVGVPGKVLKIFDTELGIWVRC